MSAPETCRLIPQDRWVEHPQGRIFTRSWRPEARRAASGSATPIVLFHDSLGCTDLWRDFPAQLAAVTGRCVISYDRLGFGRSDPRNDRPSLDFIAEESTAYFAVLREQLGMDRFIAFGHSVGGGMAIHCAADFAVGCDLLITESAQTFAEDLTLSSIAEAKAQFKDPAQIARLGRYHGEKAAWVVDAWTGNWLDPGFAAWTLADALPRVSCPVLALHGVHDEYGTTRHPEMIGSLCGGPSQVEILAATCHVPHRERPELVLDLVSRFIDSFQGRGSDQQG